MMRVVAGPLSFLLVSCATPVERQPAPSTMRSWSGETLCAIHKIPLTTIHGWTSGTIILSHPIDDEGRKDEACNPNRMPLADSLTRTKECTIPTEITYCRWCQQ